MLGRKKTRSQHKCQLVMIEGSSSKKNPNDLDQMLQKVLNQRTKLPQILVQPSSKNYQIEDKTNSYHLDRKKSQQNMKSPVIFYDEWYIPYKQRFIKRPNKSEIINPFEKGYFQYENYFYHNIHNVENFLKYDPFLNKMPEATQNMFEQSKRIDSLREMLKGSKVMQEYKKSLNHKGIRVPVFIKNILSTQAREEQ